MVKFIKTFYKMLKDCSHALYTKNISERLYWGRGEEERRGGEGKKRSETNGCKGRIGEEYRKEKRLKLRQSISKESWMTFFNFRSSVNLVLRTKEKY